MSVTLFELPPPGELGGGWSLRFLTAGEMLECRTEGEARAGEERDKALWANAALLARVLLKEGEPAFPDGEAVLASLTVGQMEGLTRRWWAQDNFSGDSPGRVSQEEWGTREGSVNEGFDMARFLELGGGEAPAELTPAGTAFAPGPAGLPGVWPGSTLPMQAQAIPGVYREDLRADLPREWVTIPGGGAMAMERIALPTRKEVGGAESVPEEYSEVKIVQVESPQAEPGLTAEELDRAVERDARRYDGGLTLL